MAKPAAFHYPWRMPVHHPGLARFIELIAPELIFGELLIVRWPNRFELRHRADRDIPRSDLENISADRWLEMAQFNSAGAYRPLKSAPNLRRGWLGEVRNADELDLALQVFYPGALADWTAVQSGFPPVADFRAVAERQTGMYRITALLSNAQIALAIASTCAPRFCLKRRLWSTPEAPPDEPSDKSLIPCLEPCPLFMEFARQVLRISQEESIPLSLTPSDAAAILAALDPASQAGSVREADFRSPANPHRQQLAFEKLKHLHPALASQPEEE